MPPKRAREPIFRLGRYWIDTVAGSSRYYRFWYDPRTGEVRKRTLATSDLETAKARLAVSFLQEGDGKARAPQDVSLAAVLNGYFEGHSDKRPNPSAARRAGDLILGFLNDESARVGDLSKTRQQAFLRHLRDQHGHSVAYISRVQSIIAAALRRAVAEEDDDGGLLTRAPRIIVQPAEVARILDAPEPEPRNWHPDVKMLARFLDSIPPEEETRLLRFTILTLVFGRPEAVRELTPFQIDERHKLVHLNAEGRRQTKKFRATLPMPDALWPLLLTWRDAGTIVHKDGKPVRVLRKPWAATRAAAKLPDLFVPKSLKHMLATELRRRGVEKEQRELWQGHRRESTNDRYGRFDPEFMGTAKAAVNALLLELSATCKTSSFRQVSAKRGRRRLSMKVISGGKSVG